MSLNNLFNLLNFDIDRYVNPYIPQSRLYLVPQPFRHFLGYRSKPHREPPTVVQWISTLISTTAGLCLVGATFNYAPGLADYYRHPLHDGQILIASLGASAVLEYNAMRSPLAQPRNSLLGQTLSAVVGVAVSKAFQHSSLFPEIQWLSAAVGAACASVVMSMTNTVYPPGGATAILASIDSAHVELGWMLVPFVLLSRVLMMCVALLFNNVLRQYPLYWWTAEPTGRKLMEHRAAKLTEDEKSAKQLPTASDEAFSSTLHEHVDFVDELDEVRIMPYRIQMPSHLELSDEEVLLLELIQERMQKMTEVGG